MKISVRGLAVALMVVAAMALTACGGSSSSSGASNGAIELGTDGENLAFNNTALTAKAGEKVSITFKNNSSAQSHNFILVNGGEDVATALDEAAAEAADAGYIPADATNIIAHTALLAPGASETVEFTAPAAGTYTFVCTYPGHFGGGMKGVLTVN